MQNAEAAPSTPQDVGPQEESEQQIVADGMLQLVQNDPELLQAIQTITGHGVGQLAVADDPEPSAEEILAQDQPQWWVCEKLDRGGQEFGRWCLLCKRFLSAGHALQDQHKQRRLSPEEFLTKQDAEWYREEYAKAISEQNNSGAAAAADSESGSTVVGIGSIREIKLRSRSCRSSIGSFGQDGGPRLP